MDNEKVIRLEAEKETLIKENERLHEQLDNYIMRVVELEDKIKVLEAEKRNLQRHNARGAGRKPWNAEWKEKFDKFSRMVSQEYSKQDIMDIMKISLSTYKRYMKMYKEIEEEEFEDFD